VGLGKIIGTEILICCVFGIAGRAQDLTLPEWIAKHIIRTTLTIGRAPPRLSCTDHLEYTLTPDCLVLINWLHDSRINKIDLIQSFQYRYLLANGRGFRLSGSFVHNLGFVHYFDSITKAGIDDNTLSTRMDLTLHKRLSFTMIAAVSSRLLNGYDYINTNSGTTIRVLNSAFLTPAVCTFSCGLGYTLKNFGSLHLGISSLKLTSILNREIFSARKISSYYGIEQGKTCRLEYGILLQMIIDKDFFRILHWDCDLQIFRNYYDAPDLSMKNLFGLRITRFLKIVLQTRIFYEEKVSRHLQVENLFSIGFSVQM
jgi:hypothetical protein